MVLFKRKPVQYVPRPALLEDQEIWVIDKTGEVFTNYDEYLARIDYYKQRRFICEITGHSGLDFFAALEKEQEASSEVDDAFPDPLREPILRKVQHSTISRIDNLVDTVFDEFKQDFFPGEEVQVVLEGHERMPGIVREKSRFNELYRDDGSLERAAFVRYFVSLTNQPDHEAIVDNEHIIRDRKIFSKQMLRSFLKNSLHREAWSGAPWQVKEHLAHEYRINTTIPPHLQYESQIAQRKLNGSKRTSDYGGTILSFFPPKNGLPELKPKSHHKAKATGQEATLRHREGQFQAYQHALSNQAFESLGDEVDSANHPKFLKWIHQNPNFPAVEPRVVAPKPPPPPPIKYPREDLELDISHFVRPPMKFLSVQAPASSTLNGHAHSGISVESVGLLLETWNTLNVYCEVFLLDSFTFDDYVEALSYPSSELPSELLTEIHCAVLKKLVNGENEQNGHVHINLPSDDESDYAEEESGDEPSPSPEPEIEKRTTRGSLRKSDAAAMKAQLELAAKIHNGAEIDQSVKGYGWKVRLRKRDFLDGRWVVIIVGLLNVYTADSKWRKKCEEILAKLAPPQMDATEDTAIYQYGEIDINTRVQIIQFICMLSLGTSWIKSYMEECTTQMTQYRKDKVEWQRQRKAHLEELRALDEERRALQPEAKSPVAELEELEVELKKEDAKVPETEAEDEDVTMEDAEDDDEDIVPTRSLRRANDRAAERRRRQEEDRKKKEEAKTEKANKPSKEAKQLEKVLKKIDATKEKIKECESEIAVCDGDLRESDCHRTRVLGKDRYWNRYYWFERNAMPYGGLPDSSTAEAGYANGCIWVQGPDDTERLGFIDIPDADQAQYKSAYGLSVSERKMKEEGDTHTFTAHQWGYYDDPDELDKLIGWLNDKGVREIKLRKELTAQREQMSIRMRNRREYIGGAGAPRSESPPARVSSRAKASANPPKRRCMKWTNETAKTEFGHLHVEPQVTKRRGVARPVDKSKKAAVQDEGRQTRASNRQGKVPTRQGTRYSF